MDHQRFDAWTRTLFTRRRGLFAALLSGLVTTAFPDLVRAGPAAATCTPNGPACGRRTGGKRARRACRHCCSGCTSGRKPRKVRCSCCPLGARCRRDDQCCGNACRGGVCAAGDPGDLGAEACLNPTGVCAANPASCGGTNRCACMTTLAGAAGCYETAFVCDGDRSTCATDADCLGAFGAGFACIGTAGCPVACGGNGNACVAPCRGS